MPGIISPSVLSADFTNLGRDVEMLNQSQADWIHFDVMDGVFVPNISFGLPVLKAVKKIAKKPLDVHLMIAAADNYLEAFKEAGADHIIVHAEACTHLHRTLNQIRALGLKSGLAINPHTAPETIAGVLSEIDILLVMSVNPGFGGQKFIPSTLDKLRKINRMKKEGKFNFLVEVDGGVDLNNAGEIIKAGADALVAGNAVFSAPDPAGVIAQMKNL
jgi:ribulose-phosphate 3-epimerase